MTPRDRDSSDNPVTRKWALRLDWWERILSVMALPIMAAVIAWGSSVEERMHEHGARLDAIEEFKNSQEELRREILRSLDAVRERQVEVLQRLSRIEALVTK